MLRLGPLKPTIANRLIAWFLLISLFPFAVVMYMSYYAFKETLTDQVMNDLSAIAEGKANQIEGYVLERKRDVTTLSHDPTIIDAIRRFEDAFRVGGVDSPGYLGAEEEFRPFLTDYHELSGYYDLLLISPDGHVVFSVKREEDLGANLRTGIYRDSGLAGVFDRASTLMETEMSDFEFYPPSNKPVAFIAAPVFEGGMTIGVVALQMSNEDLYKVVTDYVGLRETGEVVVAKRKGDEAIFAAPLRHEQYAEFRRTAAFGSPEGVTVQEALHGKKGSGKSIDYRGQEVLAVWEYLPSLRWGMVVKVDAREALAGIVAFRNRSLVIGMTTVFLVVLMAVLVSRSISVPIIALHKGTEIIGSGDLDHSVGTKAKDEIGQLSRAFDRMAGNLKGVMVSRDDLVREVAERKRAEEALKQRTEELEAAKDRAEEADRLKSAFLATMSHELRTPLNSIIGFTGLVLQGLAGPLNDEQTKQLGMVRKSAHHLLALINDILDLSKIEAGQVEIVKEEFAVADLVDKVVNTVSPLAEQKGLELTVALSPEVGQIYSDRRRVEQILLNLVNNAVKFTKRGRVRIEGAIVDEYLQVSVEDAGIGIKAEDMGTLFQTFRQVQTVSTRNHEGTGLGLSICKKVVTMLGGEIWAESEWGVGSTFTFTLPIEKRESH